MVRTIENKRERLERFESLAEQLGVPAAHVALAWLLHNPVVTAPIIGPRTLDQLTGVLAVPDLKLDSSTLARLDEIFPGPGGEAPMAYAW